MHSHGNRTIYARGELREKNKNKKETEGCELLYALIAYLFLLHWAVCDTSLPPSLSLSLSQGKSETDGKTTGTRRQTKKAKVETNSQNIKDMFNRATRKKK